VLQQLLESAHEGTFELGKLPKRGIGQSFRLRIYRDYLKVVCDARSAAEQIDLQRAFQRLSQDEHNPAGAAEASETHSASVHLAANAQASPLPQGPSSSGTIERQGVPGSNTPGERVLDTPVS